MLESHVKCSPHASMNTCFINVMSQRSMVGPEISRTLMKFPLFMINVIVSSLICEEKVGSPVLILSPSLLADDVITDVVRDRMNEICSILPLLSSSVWQVHGEQRD